MSVYISHPITGAGLDDTISADASPLEPAGVTILARRMTDVGVECFRPIYHNPWDPANEDRRWPHRIDEYPPCPPIGPAFSSPLDSKQDRLASYQRGHIGAEQVLGFDIGAIEACRAVFAFLDQPSVGVSQEMVYACMLGIPVFGVTANRPSPRLSMWAVAHATHVFDLFQLLSDSEHLELLVKAYNIRNNTPIRSGNHG